MEISLRTAFYVGANALIGAVSLYKTPYPFEWLTGLAVGLFAGHYLAKTQLELIERSPFPLVKDDAMRRITYLVPGAIMTFLTCAIWTIITQQKTNSLLREDARSTITMAVILGIALSHLFILDDMRRSTHPDVVPRMQALVL